jgi:hypothetical protein
MNAYLEGIRAKLSRANEHIDNLNLEIASFLGDNYRIVAQCNVESRQYMFTAFGQPEVPPRFSVVIGEIVHHLRSCLDHLVTQLAAIGPGGGNANVLEFPICRTPETFRDSCERGKIKGVTDIAATLIEELQPYRTSSPVERSSLLILHDLSRSDKHRLLVVVVAVVQMADRIAITAADREVEIIGMSPPIKPGVRPAKDGTEIFKIFFGEKFDPNVQMKGNFGFQVAFGQDGPLKDGPVVEVMVTLRDAVVHSIQRFFPEFKM